MGLRKGTRLTDNPKSTMLRVRVDGLVLNKLDEIVRETSLSRSEIMRRGIEIQHESLKKGEK